MSPLIVGAVKPGSTTPVVTLTLNSRPGIDLPAADWNPPATYTDVPSAAGRTL